MIANYIYLGHAHALKYKKGTMLLLTSEIEPISLDLNDCHVMEFSDTNDFLSIDKILKENNMIPCFMVIEKTSEYHLVYKNVNRLDFHLWLKLKYL